MKEQNKKNAVLISGVTLGLFTLAGCGTAGADTKVAPVTPVAPEVPPFRENAPPTPTIKINEAKPVINTSMSKYKDGTYTVLTQYDSPAGPESMGVTVVLKNDLITDTSFEVKASAQRSIGYQKAFAGEYKSLVIGKNIDTLSLGKVAGASLTSKGFDLALDQLKAKAK